MRCTELADASIRTYFVPQSLDGLDDAMTLGRPDSSGPAFEAMMADIDAKLKVEGTEIPNRPLLAVREVSMEYNLSIPLGGPSEGLPDDLRENVDLAEAIRQWYDDNYGDRIKTDFCPGMAVVDLDGDLYEMRVPRIFGEARFVLSREWIPNPGIMRGPALCNIVQLASDMTPAKAARLTDTALRGLGEMFEIAVPALYTLESTSHRLMHIARGDVAVAVRSLLDLGGRYGESKWASLQTAEKVLKAAIDKKGATFKFTHGLGQLCDDLRACGLRFDAAAQVAAIQCKPGIRYGDEPCTRDEALRAHHASLELVNILRKAGAEFELGIGGLTPEHRS